MSMQLTLSITVIMTLDYCFRLLLQIQILYALIALIVSVSACVLDCDVNSITPSI